jgi:hypothetical protein
MNNDEFLKRLSEVAEWYRPHTGPNGAASVNKRAKLCRIEHPGTVTEAELAAMDEEEITEYYERLLAWREAQPNASVPPEIKKLKIQAVDCEDCGRHCAEGRRVQSKICNSGQPHWRTSCVTCELYRDPATGKFTLNSRDVQNYLMLYYRPKLGVYSSKHQPKVKEPKLRGPRGRPKKLTKTQIAEQIRSEGDWIIRETDESITKFFVPKNKGLD